GIELIRKLRAQKAHGLVTPLVTTASGAKFGKTEAGTIWLDRARTSEQEFRQFWLHTDDRDVISYLKFFTFLTKPEIDALDGRTTRAPEKREAQAVLADCVGELVHGQETPGRIARANTVLFSATSGDLNVSVSELLAIADDVPSTRIAGSEFGGQGIGIVDAVARVFAVSKSAARRLVEQGGISVNRNRVRDPNERLTREHAWEGRIFLLQRGSKQVHLILLT